jgi:hypothetical protein
LLNSFALPRYAKVDTNVYCTARETDRGSWKLPSNIKNALDREFYETSTGPITIRPGAPIYGCCDLAVLHFTRELQSSPIYMNPAAREAAFREAR